MTKLLNKINNYLSQRPSLVLIFNDAVIYFTAFISNFINHI